MESLQGESTLFILWKVMKRSSESKFGHIRLQSRKRGKETDIKKGIKNKAKIL